MAQNSSSEKLFNLVSSKDFFRLATAYKNEKENLKDWQKVYFEALTLSIFNDPARSNIKIEEFLKEYSQNLNDSLAKTLYEARENNELKLFRYKDAAITSKLILEKYAYLMSTSEKEEEEDALIIWNACEKVSPQTADIQGDSHIKIKKDMAGLMNVPITINGIADEFIFDTGANISTVSKSKAAELKLRFMKGKLKIGTATSIKVEGEIAVADKLVIGNIIYTNVLFLVVPDESLSFAGGMYVIHGIIGIPLMKEMKEIQFSENELFIPKNTTPKELHNLALESFMPVIMGVEGSDTLCFNFDSGARTTMLYQPYYIKRKKEIDKTFTMKEIEVEGAGGKITVNGFTLNKISLSIGSTQASLENINLAAENFTTNDKYSCGNLGQDYIKQFKTMILNFESMYIDFQN